jgi:catechol 2,3-dioxygenase
MTQTISTPPPGYRLPPEARIGRVTLQVADLTRSLTFYREVLGFREGREIEGAPAGTPAGADGPVATLTSQDSDTVLVELHERPGARRVPTRGLLGLFHFAIVVPDRPALGRFLRHIIDRNVPLGAADHMVSEALYLTDPDGLGIEVYRDRSRSEWIIDNGRVMGGSDPLDAEGILDAAGGQPWTGMPAGTRIGHVHFHVGDLARAREFYHLGLGLDHVNWPFPGAMFLSAGGYHHHVGVNTWAAGAPPAAEEDARLLEWELLLPASPDVDRAAASLLAAGHPVHADETGARSRDMWGIVVAIRTVGGDRDMKGRSGPS